jgi:hypothetical protein
MPALCLQKIAFAEMREAGVRGVLIYCGTIVARTPWPIRRRAVGQRCPSLASQAGRGEDITDREVKRRDRPYQAGRSKHSLKIKNRKHPAIDRGTSGEKM